MAWREKALTAIIPAVVFLSLMMAPTWSMAFLILFGVIAPAVVASRRNAAPAVDAPAIALAVDAVALDVDAPALAVDAPALDADAPALAVDALALAVDAAGRKMRRRPESSSTSSSSSRFEYDVYLNFRAPDTRNGIVDHLCTQLVDAGVRVFRDEIDLAPGKDFELEMKEALKQSKISIAILSKNYASSRWCLDELVQMWEYRKTNGQTFLPIFYGVSAYDVRYQTGDFGMSFELHKRRNRVDSNTIETWQDALRQISSLRGLSPVEFNGHEGQLVKRVVAHVLQVLEKDGQVVTDDIVGIDLHVPEMMRKLGVAYSEGRAIQVHGEDVRVFGICGVPGVGKTTLAKAVYYEMRKLFDAGSFLENIRSEGVQFSRHKLIDDLQNPATLESSGEEIEEIASLCHNAKVLIVLDDVDEDGQIKELAGKLIWFGPGSRIIVTTNNRKVLKAFDVGAVDHGMVEEHTVKPMDHGHALQLFCKHAFQGAAAQDSEYFVLSVEIAKAIGGLPLDIVRHASFLRDNMNIDTWKTTLDLLQKNPKTGQAAFLFN